MPPTPLTKEEARIQGKRSRSNRDSLLIKKMMLEMRQERLQRKQDREDHQHAMNSQSVVIDQLRNDLESV